MFLNTLQILEIVRNGALWSEIRNGGNGAISREIKNSDWQTKPHYLFGEMKAVRVLTPLANLKLLYDFCMDKDAVLAPK